jgi:hypothetical protein
LGGFEVLWDERGSEWYRMMLYADGEEVFVSMPKEGVQGGEIVRVRKGFRREDVEKVLSKGGKLSAGESLRCKMRYLSDGMVLGTKEFVNGVFKAARERFGEKRKSGARPMREVGWKDKGGGKGVKQRGEGVGGTSSRLYTMRALRKDVVE